MTQQELKEGKTLLVDKPYDMTSFEVVKKVRYHLKKQFGFQEKLKVGHAGTLDPKATGLLIICIGKKTKSIHEFQGLSKTYKGILKLGVTSPSLDEETEITSETLLVGIDNEKIREAARFLTGTYEQTPPLFSAKKVKGKRAYEHAREGKAVEMKKNIVKIHRFNIDKVSLPYVKFTVNCSKGTYIRSLARDIGKNLNTGAILSELRRTTIGDLKIEQAWDLDVFLSEISSISSSPDHLLFLE
ncbi:MAG: tRNA pseudouridine(55) synthase TruB [Flavobacteriales bacterium]